MLTSRRERTNVGSTTGNKFSASTRKKKRMPVWPPGPERWPLKKPEQQKMPAILPSGGLSARQVRADEKRFARSKAHHSIDGWQDKFGLKTERPARSLAELKKKQARARLPYTIPGIDIDGDGIVDEVEIKLSQILENVPGEDLDGDGEVTEEEIIATRIKKGKEIFARTFVSENPGIQDFWHDFKGMSKDEMIAAIKNNADFKMCMRNLQNKGRQYEMLYKSKRISECLNMDYTARNKKHQKLKDALKRRREAIYKQKLMAALRPATSQSGRDSLFQAPLSARLARQ